MTAETRLRYDPDAKFEVKTHDIVYRRAGDTDLVARIYQPQGDGPFPALLDVHGGAWGKQSHLNNEVSQQHFAESGILVMAIDFRASDIAPHPAAQEDQNYALRWLKAHAADYNGSAEHVGIVGWSSGGHQVILGAMKPEEFKTIPLDEAPGLDGRPAYVIMGWPVLDPVARYQLAIDTNNPTLQENHLRYFGDMAGQEAHNPPRILERGETVELPPALLVQGSADESLPRMMAERFIELYSLAGGVIEAGKYPGGAHGFMREPGPNTDRARTQCRDFIARQLAFLQQ
jgi:acetyl esterase/lipase